MDKIVLYHGSSEIIEKPEYGKGKPYNDYGLGFYCTENIELAKEWAVDINHDGFVNKYELNTENLKIIDLNGKEYNVLNWISVLLKYRKFTLENEISKEIKKYLIENYSVDFKGIDIVKGYRADDSYFSYARDFVNNTISLDRLSLALKLGNLGEQIVLISEKSFEKINFVGYEKVSKDEYLPKKFNRDKNARSDYFTGKKGIRYSKDDIYAMDLLRGELK